MSVFTAPQHRGGLGGRFDLPTSKSLTNRALVAAAVAGGGSVLSPLDCDDTRVLASALSAAGWRVAWETAIEVGPREAVSHQVKLDFRDSGTGSRLALAVLAASPGRFLVDGSSRLRERPMRPLIECLETIGADLESADGYLPVKVTGRVLEGGTAEIMPGVSSQFVSALVMAAPLMTKGLDLVVSGHLPSAPYLDLTMDVLRAFGGRVEVSGDRRRWIVAPVPLENREYTVEGDWSAAAFALAAVAVAGGELEIGPLDPASRQGDRAVARIMGDAGLDLDWRTRRVIARGPVTAPLTADLQDTPDLFPALAAVAACSPPGSRFFGLEHLKHKESDRLTVMVNNLESLGAKMVLQGSELTVEDTVKPMSEAARPATTAGDHRIAMALAVAALGAGPIELDDPDCVTKSFPGFWEQWTRVIVQSHPEGRAP